MINELIRKIKGPNYVLPVDKVDFHAWADWYRGNVDDVHNYRWWNGSEFINMRLLTMQMGKKVCEDWANMLMNEQCDIILPDEKANDIMQSILHDMNFWVKANEAVEKSFALGLGALVLGVEDLLVGDKGTVKAGADTKLTLDFVDRFKFTPISIKNKTITEVGFTFEATGETRYILHLLENGIYKIHSYIYKNDRLVDNFVFDTKSHIAWFQMIRPFISNNDIRAGYDEALGTSIFANSLDTLKAIDIKYDSFTNEFVAGRKRLHVSDEAWSVHNKDGKLSKTFNPMDTTYFKLPNTPDGEQLIKDMSGELRVQAHVDAINMELNILSSKVGFGETYYRFDASGIATATQVMSENSQAYKTLVKHQILIDSALNDLAVAIIEASNNFTNKKIILPESDYYKIRIDFDDSIIEDKNAEMERDRLLVSEGIMSVVEFRIKWLNESEDDAWSNYRRDFKYDIINKYMSAVISGVLSPEEFVLEVYGEPKPELVEYIKNNINKDAGFGDFLDAYEGD